MDMDASRRNRSEITGVADDLRSNGLLPSAIAAFLRGIHVQETDSYRSKDISQNQHLLLVPAVVVLLEKTC